MRLPLKGRKHEELHREEDNTWGKYLLRSNGVCRIILGAALTLTLTLLANPAQAQAGSRASPSGDENLVQGWMGKRYAKSSGVSEPPTTEGHCPAGRTLLDGAFKSPKTVPSPVALHLAINYRLATFSAAIYPV
jgi:hypothetical protein